MPIVLSRKTGEVLHKPEYSQQAKDSAWEKLVDGWADDNMEVLVQLKEQSGQDLLSGGSPIAACQ